MALGKWMVKSPMSRRVPKSPTALDGQAPPNTAPWTEPEIPTALPKASGPGVPGRPLFRGLKVVPGLPIDCDKAERKEGILTGSGVILTVNPTPMKTHIIPMVIYAQQRLRGSALPTEELQIHKSRENSKFTQ